MSGGQSGRRIESLEGMRDFARSIVPRLGIRQVVLMNGPMGVGKTQFARDLMWELGSREVVSPSFAIHHRYETTRGPVDHVDLFRLETEDDLESTGFWDLFAAKEGLILIEWAQRLPASSLSPGWQVLRLDFAFASDGTRLVSIA